MCGEHSVGKSSILWRYAVPDGALEQTFSHAGHEFKAIRTSEQSLEANLNETVHVHGMFAYACIYR